MMRFLFFFVISLPAFPQGLKTYSEKINKSLPETYDHATKLLRTRVENNDLNFDFVVDATKDEFALAFPKVRSQVLSTICRQSRERTVLRQFKANVVYRYESVKGQALGEFMIRPDHCEK